ncbi:refilin-B-like isoform X1 [Acanthaster planci]|uniref:Refilin-B-like isoform X1 n=1 Tax=Acanthaster planci TaxID=133434 RepID=A0A8B7YP62_ACAPL|nr:refilin-B-like isoform X1 [Acanthaster planci]
MVFLEVQRTIVVVRTEVTEKDIDPADIPFGRPSSAHKRLSYGESFSGSSYSGSSSSYSRTDSGSESDSCFSEEEQDEESGTARQAYKLPYRRYTESVSLTERPPYQRRHYGLEWVIRDNRRFREEVRLHLGAKPTTTYSTTTQCFPNSKFRWYRDAVYMIPGAAALTPPKTFTTTVFVFPKFPQRNVVSSLEHHSAKMVKRYRVAVELEARDFVSVKLVHLSY